NSRNIMRDMMLVNVSGLPGHAMGIDLNIEHLIRYLKALFSAKGIYANWDRLGNISAAVHHLQQIKKQVACSMGSNYQGSTHTKLDTHELVWQIANKACDLRLQHHSPNREGNSPGKLVPDLWALGRAKFASSSLDTFNKKIHELISGKVTIDEADELPPLNFDSAFENDDDNNQLGESV
ncbi:hypothetical protein L208DRAFT_1323038, partial [Tricholoma matsutake]